MFQCYVSTMNPTVICLTPVRNEAWILDNFLNSASLWADYIIIADQMSTDGSREIALRYPKVKLIDNTSEVFNEPERQKLLINEARKIEGKRLLITLDADEMFSPEIFKSDEWKEVVLKAEPGTVLKFQWANIRPDLKNMWYGDYFPWGFMDDGAEYTAKSKIHTSRIPLSDKNEIVKICQIKVIHFQYANWTRMLSKHRWYQCLEIVNYPEKSAVDIFRIYHHMFAVPKSQIIPIPKHWVSQYKLKSIAIFEFNLDANFWFEKQVIEFFEEFGTSFFKKLFIWDVQWESKAQFYGKTDLKEYIDPRSIMDKLIQFWLIRTQPISNLRCIQRVDSFIKRKLNY